MKIFQVITVSEYGGAQSVVANLCRGLLQQGDRVFLLYGGDGEAWGGLDASVTRLRIGKHRKEVSWKDVFVWMKLLYFRFRYRPDIVHLHSSKMGALGRLAFAKKKTVYTVHGFDSMRTAFRRFLFVERLLAPVSGCVVGVSNYDLAGMKEERIKAPLKMVYNGIPDYAQENVAPDPDVADSLQQIRSRYGRIILCIARISKQKNFELFLATALRLPQYAFVWIGNEETIPGLPPNVFCLGNQSRAYRYLGFADLFMLPSHYEGLPVSIIEAMCFSKPVLASRVGGVPELIDQGVTGYALDNDADAFAAHIQLIARDDSLIAAMGQNARAAYEKKFTLSPMIEGYKKIYDGLQ